MQVLLFLLVLTAIHPRRKSVSAFSIGSKVVVTALVKGNGGVPLQCQSYSPIVATSARSSTTLNLRSTDRDEIDPMSIDIDEINPAIHRLSNPVYFRRYIRPTGNAALEKAFLEHTFHERGFKGDPNVIRFGTSRWTQQRGLHVTSDISEGDCVFAVPLTSCWIVEKSEGAHDELSDAERGLLFWKWQQEQEQGNDKFWKLYNDMLPKRDRALDDIDQEWLDPTPDFWPEEDIRELELPTMVERTHAKQKRVEALARSNRELLTEDDLRFATWIVNSRAIRVLESLDENGGDDLASETKDDKSENLQTTSVLVPLLDMINHHFEPNVHFSVVRDGRDSLEKNHQEKIHTSREVVYIAVIANRDLKKGEELQLSYGAGNLTSIDLLLQYGFVSQFNQPADELFWDSFFEASGFEEESYDREAQEKYLPWDPTISEYAGYFSFFDNDLKRTIREFRVRMKKAYLLWSAMEGEYD